MEQVHQRAKQKECEGQKRDDMRAMLRPQVVGHDDQKPEGRETAEGSIPGFVGASAGFVIVILIVIV
jgi:hypothetical protein